MEAPQAPTSRPGQRLCTNCSYLGESCICTRFSSILGKDNDKEGISAVSDTVTPRCWHCSPREPPPGWESSDPFLRPPPPAAHPQSQAHSTENQQHTSTCLACRLPRLTRSAPAPPEPPLLPARLRHLPTDLHVRLAPSTIPGAVGPTETTSKKH